MGFRFLGLRFAGFSGILFKAQGIESEGPPK